MRSVRILMFTTLSLLLGGMVLASGQTTSAIEGGRSSSEPGITFYETFFGSTNTLGQIYKLDSNVGYNFNRWWGADAGVPVYFLQPSSTGSAAGMQSGTGMGNAYVDLNLYVHNPAVNYISTLEGTAPTGYKDLGLTTGRFTYDWNNHFDRSLLILTPFANVGYANTVSDTPLFTRPFTTFGRVFHLEGGAMMHALPFVSVGGSLYDIVPTGEQRIYSRFNPRAMGTVHAQGNLPGRFFTGAHETIGSADLARDNGASLWASIGLFHFAEAEIGYTRSVRYDLNTVSFGIGFDVGHLIRAAH